MFGYIKWGNLKYRIGIRFYFGGSSENLMRPWVQFWCPLSRKIIILQKVLREKKKRIIVKIFFLNMLCNERI